MFSIIFVSLRCLIADQLNIRGAFLYSYQKEEIYICLPLGYKQLACCVPNRKLIPGLKFSLREQYERQAGQLLPLRYRPMNFDPYVMFDASIQIIIAIYINEISILGTYSRRKELKETLKKKSNLSNIYPLNWLLGIQIKQP